MRLTAQILGAKKGVSSSIACRLDGHVQEDAGPKVWVSDLEVDVVAALGTSSKMVNALRVCNCQVPSSDGSLEDGEDRAPCYRRA